MPAIECSARRRRTGRGWLCFSGLGAWRIGPPHLLAAERILALSQGPPPRIFTTKQEAKSSCPVRRNTGSGIFGHTSRRRTRQSPNAGYPHRNLGKIGGTARIGRPTEFRCARRRYDVVHQSSSAAIMRCQRRPRPPRCIAGAGPTRSIMLRSVKGRAERAIIASSYETQISRHQPCQPDMCWRRRDLVCGAR